MNSTTHTLISREINRLFNSDDNAAILKCQIVNPEKAVLTVNATEPFVLATSQVLNKDWVAIVNGRQIKPTSLYLGLEGFIINQTGIINITMSINLKLGLIIQLSYSWQL